MEKIVGWLPVVNVLNPARENEMMFGFEQRVRCLGSNQVSEVNVWVRITRCLGSNQEVNVWVRTKRCLGHNKMVGWWPEGGSADEL